MDDFGYLGADEKTDFDTMSFIKKTVPAVVTAATESIDKKSPPPSAAPVDATGRHPDGSSGSWLSDNKWLVAGGAAVVGLGGFLLLRK